MSQTAGLLLVAMAALWIAYLVPHRLRYRQQLAESRTDDRFSERLRVVRVAAGPGARPERQDAASGGRVLLHPPRRGGGAVDRPHRPADRLLADAVRRTAAERAARAAYLARRRAAARRRAVLAGLLLVATAAGWVAVAGGALLAAGVAPSVLLASVLVLGRRAVIAGRRADAAWAAGAPQRAATPRSTREPTAVGHARRPSDATTEVLARVAAELEEVPVPPVGEAVDETDETADAADDGPTWEPVPVPRPAYALKPAVRRPEPAPLVLDERPVAETAADADAGAPAEPAAAAFDLDAVLARRRAAGA
ncbi:MAG: hypothetical protein GX609_00235 [Actinomycetales bacterium]|nr:hypothetical protein [Actinomycetales bacterium]